MEEPPSDMIPFVIQLLNVVRACRGVLGASNFAVHAETLMSLDKTHTARQMVAANAQGRIHTSLRGCSLPASLARSIMAIGKVSLHWMVSSTEVHLEMPQPPSVSV